MAKPRQRRKRQTKRNALPPPEEENRNAPPFRLGSEPINDERRAVLETIPSWARVLRLRSSLAVGVALVGAVVTYTAAGEIAGPAVAGVIMVGTGLALWRADKLETRAMKRLGIDEY